MICYNLMYSIRDTIYAIRITRQYYTQNRLKNKQNLFWPASSASRRIPSILDAQILSFVSILKKVPDTLNSHHSIYVNRVRALRIAIFF
jgi:hypothetical protein